MLLLFLFNDPSTTAIYTLSLHDALPISRFNGPIVMIGFGSIGRGTLPLLERHIAFDRSKFVVIDPVDTGRALLRSEEHTSELQSLRHLVCRLLLEKKKKKICNRHINHYL